MTRAARIEWRSDEELCIDDTTFRVVPVGRSPSTPDRFLLLKNRQMVEAYIDLADSLEARRIVELGIFEGGSTALLELVFGRTGWSPSSCPLIVSPPSTSSSSSGAQRIA